VRGALVVATLFCAGNLLWQIDWVRQYSEMAWIAVSGHRWVLHGNSTAHQMTSPSTGDKRIVVVYTPPGYNDPAQAATHYPVLYLLHGSPDPNGDSWVRFGRAPEIVDRMIVTDNFPPIIVVCPNANGIGTFGDSEYIDAPAYSRRRRSATRIESFIDKDLVAWTDKNFRTIDDPRARILGGASSGGYGAVNIGLKHPDIYSMMISLSGYYRADPTGWARPVWGRHPSNSDLLENSPVDYLANGNPQWRQDFIYVGDGTSDRTYYRNSDKQMVAALTRQGIPYAFQLVPGRHSWDLWRTLLVNALGDLRPRLIDVSKPAG